MVTRLLITLLSITTLIQCQEPLNDNLGYIYNIQPQITSEETIVREITNSLTAANKYGIVLADIIKLFKLDSVTRDELLDILNSRNPSYTKNEVFNLIEFVLKQSGKPFNSLAVTISKNLGLSNRFFSNNLDKFNIDKTEYTETVVYDPGEEFILIKNGLYTEENIENFITETGKSKDELFIATRDEFINILKQASLQETQDFLSKLKIPFNVLSEKRPFSLDDLNRIPSLTELVDKIKNITGIIFNGLAVTSVGIIVSKKTAKELEENIEMLDVQISNNFENYVFAASSLVADLNYASFPVKSFNSSITIGQNEKDITNCSLVLLQDGTEIVAPVYNLQVEDVEILGEVESPEFVRGGALICKDKAYGLARSRNSTHIIFDNIFRSGSSKLISSVLLLPSLLAILFKLL